MEEQFYYARVVRGLIGDDHFSKMLASKIFDYFYKLSDSTKTAFWKAVIHRINEGVTDIEKLIRFADTWMELYRQFKNAIHDSNILES